MIGIGRIVVDFQGRFFGNSGSKSRSSFDEMLVSRGVSKPHCGIIVGSTLMPSSKGIVPFHLFPV
jgi:hypothetical protein